MITMKQCVECVGLGSNETVLGAIETPRHRSLLASYLLNLGRGSEFVRDLIVWDLRGFLELGALKQASDAFLVLRMFLSLHPEACVCALRLPAAEPNGEPSDLGSDAAAPVLPFPTIHTTRHRLHSRFHVKPAARRSGAR